MAKPSLSDKRSHQVASAIIDQFQPSPFEPFLSTNPHFQTIFPAFFPRPPCPEYTRVVLQTDDQVSVFHVDIANGTSLSPAAHTDESPIPAPPKHIPLPLKGDVLSTPLKPCNPVTVIIPGLESNACTFASRRLTNAFVAKEFKVFLLNHRSCAGADDVQTTFRLYHAAFTEDLETLLRAIQYAAMDNGYFPPDVYLCGYSMGANIVSNFLGRQGHRAHTHYNVVAGAGACVPFDPISCQKELDSGWKGWVYSKRLVSNLGNKLHLIASHGVDPGKCDVEKVRNAKRLAEIDDFFVSPVFGFEDRFDYYRNIDARFVLSTITVPMFIINAKDDPFCDHMSGQSLPSAQHIASAPVRLYVSEHGGHCGFLDKQAFDDNKTGYFQRELAEWFHYVRDTLATAKAHSY